MSDHSFDRRSLLSAVRTMANITDDGANGSDSHFARRLPASRRASRAQASVLDTETDA
jgi:hypothetical protein